MNTINNFLHEKVYYKFKKSFNLIDDVYKNKNTGLVDSINFILFNFFIQREYHQMIYGLNNYLNYVNY